MLLEGSKPRVSESPCTVSDEQRTRIATNHHEDGSGKGTGGHVLLLQSTVYSRSRYVNVKYECKNLDRGVRQAQLWTTFHETIHSFTKG